ncbi:hypothetical protein EDC04DRAFT_3150666 [Pisolithus marmoratus]|nr:hypothetical protein EDC04DRAFT_3150666 [Pisolithus marmoratus]
MSRRTSTETNCVSQGNVAYNIALPPLLFLQARATHQYYLPMAQTPGTSDEIEMTSGARRTSGNVPGTSGPPRLPGSPPTQDLEPILCDQNDLLTRILTLAENSAKAAFPHRFPTLSELAVGIVLASSAFLAILSTRDNHAEIPEKLLCVAISTAISGGVTASISTIPVDQSNGSFLIKQSAFELSASIGLFTAALLYYTWVHSRAAAVVSTILVCIDLVIAGVVIWGKVYV